MEKTWMPTVAGILDIIAGVFALLGGVGVALASGFLMAFRDGFIGVPPVPVIPFNLMIVAIPVIIIGALAIAGGVYALTRRIWGLALAGSIAAFFPSWPLGIAAIVFTIMSKNEFE